MTTAHIHLNEQSECLFFLHNLHAKNLRFGPPHHSLIARGEFAADAIQCQKCIYTISFYFIFSWVHFRRVHNLRMMDFQGARDIDYTIRVYAVQGRGCLGYR